MKQIFFSCMLLVSVLAARSQAPATLYHPEADAEKDVKAAVAKAAAEKKHVILQMGGNWCGWCLKFNKFVTEDKQLDSMINANYVVYHLNYSQENQNKAQFEKYGFPQRFGFPVFVILNEKGERLHTQNSVYLEEGSSYNQKRIMDFLKDWSPAALDASKYK